VELGLPKGAKMGKTAENERIKLKATFYNNLAIGCLLSGVVAPYVLLMYAPLDVFASMITRYVLGGMIGCAICGLLLRLAADVVIRRIED
jgi:hypothetical protein